MLIAVEGSNMYESTLYSQIERAQVLNDTVFGQVVKGNYKTHYRYRSASPERLFGDNMTYGTKRDGRTWDPTDVM